MFRNLLSIPALPATWEDMGGRQWKTIQIKNQSSEYVSVMQKFNATYQFNVVKVSSLINPL